MKIKELLSSEGSWCKGNYAQNANGISVPSCSPEAVRWCIAGALGKCYTGEKYQEVHSRIKAKVGAEIGAITHWNDSSNRTFAEVKALLDELDI